MSRRLCFSCGATELQAAFPARRRGEPAPIRCVDCLRQQARDADRSPAALRTPPITRASARARFRARRSSRQLDLVDMILGPPP
jgi:hypothetical protein